MDCRPWLTAKLLSDDPAAVEDAIVHAYVCFPMRAHHRWARLLPSWQGLGEAGNVKGERWVVAALRNRPPAPT